MKTPFRRLLAAGTLALGASAFGADPAGLVDFGRFTAPAKGEFVEVQVKKNLLSLAAKLAEKHEPDAAALLRGLELVRVNVIGLDDSNRDELTQRAADVAAQLTDRGWERVVTVQQAGAENVSVFVKARGDEAVEGVVVTVLDPGGEGVFVNVVGDIRTEQLAKLGDKLNLPMLKQAGEAVEKAKEAAEAPAAP
ncbi:MAG: DUF4252 domain-containing protein [Limisphaerales bacterium]